MRPLVASSNPARIRRSVVLPEPLSPNRVRNSPCSTSSDMEASTMCSPKRLPTFSSRRKALMPSPSLARLYFVPHLGVFRPPRDILPENNLPLVSIDIVQVQAVALLRRHQRGGLWVCRDVARHIAELFLGLGTDEVIQKLISKFLVVAGRGNHQVIDPPRGPLGVNLLLDGQPALMQLVGHQRPAHARDDFMVLKQVGQLPAGCPKLADVR